MPPAHLPGAGPALCAFSLSLHDDPGTRQAPEGSHREAGEGGGETGPVDSEASWPASRDARKSMATTFKCDGEPRAASQGPCVGRKGQEGARHRGRQGARADGPAGAQTAGGRGTGPRREGSQGGGDQSGAQAHPCGSKVTGRKPWGIQG